CGRDAFGRQYHWGEPFGGRRRRALETARARRNCHPWLGLRSIRNRGHGRTRARSPWPRRRAFPSLGALRDPAAFRKTVIAGLDRKTHRGRADHGTWRTGVSRRTRAAVWFAPRR